MVCICKTYLVEYNDANDDCTIEGTSCSENQECNKQEKKCLCIDGYEHNGTNCVKKGSNQENNGSPKSLQEQDGEDKCSCHFISLKILTFFFIFLIIFK